MGHKLDLPAGRSPCVLNQFHLPGFQIEKKFPGRNLSGLHTANVSWQTRVGRLQNVGKLVPSHVKLNNANLQYGRRSAGALTQSCRLCRGLILS